MGVLYQSYITHLQPITSCAAVASYPPDHYEVINGSSRFTTYCLRGQSLWYPSFTTLGATPLFYFSFDRDANDLVSCTATM